MIKDAVANTYLKILAFLKIMVFGLISASPGLAACNSVNDLDFLMDGNNMGSETMKDLL